MYIIIELQAKERWRPLLHRDVGTLIVLNDTVVARLIVNRSPHFSLERRITVYQTGGGCLDHAC
jgi:hypothetical protein